MTNSTSNDGCQFGDTGFHCSDHINETERRRNTEQLVEQLKDSMSTIESMVKILQETLRTYPRLQKTVWLIAGAQALVTFVISGAFLYTSIVASQSIDRSHLLIGLIQETQVAQREINATVSALRVQTINCKEDIVQLQKDTKENHDLHMHYDYPTPTLKLDSNG